MTRRRDSSAILAGLRKGTTQPDVNALFEETKKILPTSQAKKKNSEISPEKPKQTTNQIFHVPLAELLENPWNARRFYQEKNLHELAQSLKTDGQFVSVCAFKDPQGRTVLIDGHYRLHAARIAGLPTLKVEYHLPPKDEREAYQRSRAINIERNAQSVLDDAFGIKKLLTSGVYREQKELAEAFSCSESEIAKMKAIAELPETVALAALEYPELCNLRCLYNISLFFRSQGEAASIRLVTEAGETGLSARAIETMRSRAERTPVCRARSDRVELASGKASATVREFRNGRIEISLRGLSQVQAEFLQEQIGLIFKNLPDPG